MLGVRGGEEKEENSKKNPTISEMLLENEKIVFKQKNQSHIWKYIHPTESTKQGIFPFILCMQYCPMFFIKWTQAFCFSTVFNFA